MFLKEGGQMATFRSTASLYARCCIVRFVPREGHQRGNKNKTCHSLLQHLLPFDSYLSPVTRKDPVVL